MSTLCYCPLTRSPESRLVLFTSKVESEERDLEVTRLEVRSISRDSDRWRRVPKLGLLYNSSIPFLVPPQPCSSVGHQVSLMCMYESASTTYPANFTPHEPPRLIITAHLDTFRSSTPSASHSPHCTDYRPSQDRRLAHEPLPPCP
jgi:hypothetical protein